MSRPPKSDAPRPFIKWAGGKTQLLPQFELLYPPASRVGRYVEPFLGSGAVFFRVLSLLRPAEALLADSNEELVNCYRAIRDEIEKVIHRLRRHRSAHCREYYYRIRAQVPTRLSDAARAARLIYLNKTCFNGLYRVNRRGGFNVPMGRYKNPPILDAENLRAVSASLQGVEIKRAHFRETPGYAREGDFIYLDPPYHPISRTSSFTSYTEGAFREADQRQLADVYTALHRMGCHVMLSNSDSALIHRLYRGFTVVKVQARRSINSKSTGRGVIPEVVVMNYRSESCRGLTGAITGTAERPVAGRRSFLRSGGSPLPRS